jgi:type VI protein secretion system component Hcp
VVLQLAGLSAPIAVESFSLGPAQTVNKSATGKVQAGDLAVSLATGPASPLLLLNAAEDTRFAEAVLAVQGSTQVTLYTLTNVSITSFRTQQGGDSITLHFTSIKGGVKTTDGGAQPIGW